MKRIIYFVDGVLHIEIPVINTHPVPEQITEDQAVQRALLKIPSGAESVVVLDPEKIPSDRTYRDLWVLNSEKTAVVVDPIRLAERLSVAYKEKRVAEYPPIGDQLDALFKAGAFPLDMAATIQAVKDKYPKE